MNALCPNCREGEGDVTERSRSESGSRVTVSCPECDHEWEIPL